MYQNLINESTNTHSRRFKNVYCVLQFSLKLLQYNFNAQFISCPKSTQLILYEFL